MKVWRKHVLSSGKGQKWPPSPMSGPMTKKMKMGSGWVKDLQGEERLQWRKLVPRKRTSLTSSVGRREEELNQPRARTSKWRPLWHHPGTLALQEICWYQKTTDLLIQKPLFVHLVWELSQECHSQIPSTESYSWQGSAIRLCRRQANICWWTY